MGHDMGIQYSSAEISTLTQEANDPNTCLNALGKIAKAHDFSQFRGVIVHCASASSNLSDDVRRAATGCMLADYKQAGQAIDSLQAHYQPVFDEAFVQNMESDGDVQSNLLDCIERVILEQWHSPARPRAPLNDDYTKIVHQACYNNANTPNGNRGSANRAIKIALLDMKVSENSQKHLPLISDMTDHTKASREVRIDLPKATREAIKDAGLFSPVGQALVGALILQSDYGHEPDESVRIKAFGEQASITNVNGADALDLFRPAIRNTMGLNPSRPRDPSYDVRESAVKAATPSDRLRELKHEDLEVLSAIAHPVTGDPSANIRNTAIYTTAVLPSNQHLITDPLLPKTLIAYANPDTEKSQGNREGAWAGILNHIAHEPSALAHYEQTIVRALDPQIEALDIRLMLTRNHGDYSILQKKGKSPITTAITQSPVVMQAIQDAAHDPDPEIANNCRKFLAELNIPLQRQPAQTAAPVQGQTTPASPSGNTTTQSFNKNTLAGITVKPLPNQTLPSKWSLGDPYSFQAEIVNIPTAKNPNRTLRGDFENKTITIRTSSLRPAAVDTASLGTMPGLDIAKLEIEGDHQGVHIA